MTERNNRVIPVIVASISLITIIVVGYPMADEYSSLRDEAKELSEMGSQYTQLRQQQRQLEKIESEIGAGLGSALNRSMHPEKRQSVRNALITIIRDSGGHLRSLEIDKGRTRPWAVDSDDPRRDSMPDYGDESNYILHAHEIEMRVDGTLETITTILRQINSQSWYLRTNNLAILPTEGHLPAVVLEMRLTVYGLSVKPDDPEDEFASHATRIHLPG